jgi:sulfate adenylyltransferase subunit 1
MTHTSPLIEQNIEHYLQDQENKPLLRFITCGSVDDGKSTLIGRLLHDSQLIPEDQLAALTADSARTGTQGDNLDFALLVDGLQSEQEQGITIDVAYRYFSTAKRKFIIADTPGHAQYTRNMVTGASNCDLAVILVDASNGVQTQTRRHSFICSLLGIKRVIVAVNKMDQVNYSRDRYKAIQDDYLKLAGVLDIPDIRFVPVSALHGDNVVSPSSRLSWFRGSTLMQYLERVEIDDCSNHQQFRLAVQRVCRPSPFFRGYQGSIASGRVAVGDTIRVLPAGTISTVRSIVTFDGDLTHASAPAAVTLTLNDEVDVSRGCMLVQKDELPHVSSRLRAKLVWMDDAALEPHRDYNFKFQCHTVRGTVETLHHRIDINSLQEVAAGTLELNEIGLVDVHLEQVIPFDAYQVNRQTGGFVVIDRLSHATVGVGLVEAPLEAQRSAPETSTFSEFELELNALIRKHFPHWESKDLKKLLK